MSKRVPLHVQYKHPLPIHHIVLPPLVPHNPVSWFYCLYVYWTSTVHVNKVVVEVEHEEDGSVSSGRFVVSNPEHMKALWNDGFFGKGALSRSEASWADRTQKRLGLGEFKNLTMEEITSIRRAERTKFKKERAKLESKQAELKKKGVVDPFIEEKLRLKDLRDKDINVKLERETYVRGEDDVLLDDDGQLLEIEKVQLQAQEVFFLKFALQSIDVTHNGIALSTEQLLNSLWPNQLADDPFILNYVVYHHYRSLGWCVRSAIKFGTDWLLYKRGPPFYHAEFAILVLPNYKDEKKNKQVSKDFVWLSSLNRVISGVRKNLVMVFVDVPEQESIQNAQSIQDVLELYKISEVLYRRWVPNKNRD